LDKKENKSNSKTMHDTERRKEIYQEGEQMENRQKGRTWSRKKRDGN
jgi:hypothetical protein